MKSHKHNSVWSRNLRTWWNNPCITDIDQQPHQPQTNMNVILCFQTGKTLLIAPLHCRIVYPSWEDVDEAVLLSASWTARPASPCQVKEKQATVSQNGVGWIVPLMFFPCMCVCSCAGSIPTYDTMNRFPRASAPPRHIDWWQRAGSCSGSWKVLTKKTSHQTSVSPLNLIPSFQSWIFLLHSCHLVLLFVCRHHAIHLSPLFLILFAFHLLTKLFNTSLQLVLVFFLLTVALQENHHDENC